MSMSAAQARTTLKEVMQYAEEGIYYDDDGELELLTERVPSYFEVRVNIRASIAANGEESLRAWMLLARFTEARDLRVDDNADTGAYSLRKVVGWMCTEGMSAEGDVDITKQQQGGTYTAVDLKKMLMTQARKWGMLVGDSNDELKSGAAKILLLSRFKDIPQSPPQDFQDLPVIIANGVEYVLFDQLVDFMQKSPQDRNVIHKALHDVTEQAQAGKDLVNYKMRTVEEDVICGTPLWDEIFIEALHRLTIATSDVDRKRSREEGWKLIAREANVALQAADGHTSSGEEIDRTVSFVRGNRSTGMAAEAGKRPKRVDEEHLFLFTWKSRRHAILITKRDVLRLGAKQWLNDNVIDMYLQSIYDEHFRDGDNMTLHVCTSFWHPTVIANHKVYIAKAGWQGRIKSTSPKLRRISNELRTTSIVLIPMNHENHWKLLLLLNVGQFLAVTEDNDDQKRPIAIVIDSFQQNGRQEWKALRTFLWYEYLSEADKARVFTPDTVDTSWVTLRDLLGSKIVYAECSQQTNTLDYGVYVCCMTA
ncbi:hypothetical protein CBR_g23627 [Chara braunii]|uniref:Ubiquitin-like protease family profile domain-containing protein n=1 Tax=Chara braunii TaxID=69332 RepID=A0A388L4X5_CHABU|nr:hypothetical protein CBR_g23627 [Chara braunii]|eukprot:GBG77298.1 hypothetical protein CBR_g23627 [Chara braunii]